MKTNPAKALFQHIARVLLNPAANGHPDIPPIGRFQIDFEGYKGITDFIGGDFFRATDPDGEAIESDITEEALKLPAVDAHNRAATIGLLLDEAIETHLAQRHPDWNDDEGAYDTLDICFAPRFRITGRISSRFLSSRTFRV